MLDDVWVRQAAESIVGAICASPENHPTRKLIEELAETTPWPGALTAGEYGRNENYGPGWNVRSDLGWVYLIWSLLMRHTKAERARQWAKSIVN